MLKRLLEFNVKVNKKKCKFYQTSVEFLGHVLDKEGVHPTKEKIKCIENAPIPKSVSELKSYLGLLNFYGKYIPMLSSKLKLLYDLCKNNTNFESSWSQEHLKVFEESKQLIQINNVLIHYNPTYPLSLTCDSSGYGIGAVLSHIIGEERPIMFASSALSPAETKYSNLEREALALMFGLQKFHKFLYGRKFTLITDHQPLQFIFGENKGIPVQAAARITRWSIILSAYDYKIRYRKGKLIANVDGLSRLPMKAPTNVDNTLCSFSLMESIPLNSVDIAVASQKDKIIAKAIDFTVSGWP